MRAAALLLLVPAFMWAGVQAAPIDHDRLDGASTEVIQQEHVESLDISSPLGNKPALSPRYMSTDNPLPGDIQIAVINATPYRWRRVDVHNYQLAGWGNPGKEYKSRWPQFIEPGQSRQYQVANRKNVWKNKDDAGEVTYALEGTDEPMSFEIRFKMTSINTFQAHVQFREELTTKTTKKGERILIGSEKTARVPVGANMGGCSFHIAGKEGDFTSTTDWNHPDLGGWMQDLLPAIGDYPLKEIVMPRSHHAALDTAEDGHYLKGASLLTGQSVTQNLPIGQQLSAEGVRILDERVYYSEDRGFIHAHMKPSRKTGYKIGSVGRKTIDVIKAINDFNDANPGELIIWDFHPLTFDFTRKNADFSPERRQEFYDMLKNNLKHLVQLPKLSDYSKLTLNDLIGNGTSAVILRFNEWEGLPGAEEGFVNTRNFRVDDHWSQKYNSIEVYLDQKAHLEGSSRHGVAHGTQFIRSLLPTQMYIPSDMTLVLMARELMTWVRFQLWNILTGEMYPNWITLDGFEGGEAKGFIIAMNKCFVARQCGDWVESNREGFPN